MTQINQALFRLRGTTSTNEKLEILGALKHDKIAEEVLNFALNPYITFGITAAEELPCDWDMRDAEDADRGWDCVWEEVKKILTMLASRELSGGAAYAAVQSTIRMKSGHTVVCIINKDLRAGVNIALANRAIPALIPTFIIGKAADTSRGAVTKYPCLAEPKYVRVRVLAMYGPTAGVQLMSSGGREYKNFPHIQKELETLGYINRILDGEVYGDTFDRTMNVAHRGRSKKDNEGIDDASFIYNVFDTLELDEFSASACSYPLTTRRTTLQMTFAETEHVRLTHGLEVNNEEEMWAYHDKIVALGYEGLVLKNLNGKYPFKRTSKEWIKVKRMIKVQGIVKGFYSGKGKFVGTLGGVEVEIGGVITKVGSGFSDNERDEIWTSQSTWHLRAVTVQGQEMTEAGRVRCPVFKGFV